MLSAERLRELLHYDPTSGVFTWRVNRTNVRAGACAGSPQAKGYWQIGVDGGMYLAHRLAWLYVYGSFPTQLLDHADRNKRNNRIANLREATKSQNRANSVSYPKNTSGHPGVSWDVRAKKWRARIKVEGKTLWLGRYAKLEDAGKVCRAAEVAAHGEFAR